MKKLIEKIRKIFDPYVMKRFALLAPKALIQQLYKRQATADLELTERIINVKKGKRKYTLLILKDKNLQTRFNLGRHRSQYHSLTASQIYKPSISQFHSITNKNPQNP